MVDEEVDMCVQWKSVRDDDSWGDIVVWVRDVCVLRCKREKLLGD